MLLMMMMMMYTFHEMVAQIFGRLFFGLIQVNHNKNWCDSDSIRLSSHLLYCCTVYQISSLTYSCLGVYKDAVDNTCEVADNSIKVSYPFIS